MMGGGLGEIPHEEPLLTMNRDAFKRDLPTQPVVRRAMGGMSRFPRFASPCEEHPQSRDHGDEGGGRLRNGRPNEGAGGGIE